jgi:hypothetical protein
LFWVRICVSISGSGTRERDRYLFTYTIPGSNVANPDRGSDAFCLLDRGRKKFWSGMNIPDHFPRAQNQF